MNADELDTAAAAVAAFCCCCGFRLPFDLRVDDISASDQKDRGWGSFVFFLCLVYGLRPFPRVLDSWPRGAHTVVAGDGRCELFA